MRFVFSFLQQIIPLHSKAFRSFIGPGQSLLSISMHPTFSCFGLQGTSPTLISAQWIKWTAPLGTQNTATSWFWGWSACKPHWWWCLLLSHWCAFVSYRHSKWSIHVYWNSFVPVNQVQIRRICNQLAVWSVLQPEFYQWNNKITILIYTLSRDMLRQWVCKQSPYTLLKHDLQLVFALSETFKLLWFTSSDVCFYVNV